ncbi:hypothetical protein TNIN_319511 [Trichonephila inaurata madagascariensis]|uniref:Uncharacterized protein n=1 Tax=Trichonephila inaurata madagascariensis TaxID=2747483 RepID=A0A8X6WVA8_9ARAC|nr:hypothetical protein TNIN_319511 [Trichonephila inaurata madagascariensis]
MKNRSKRWKRKQNDKAFGEKCVYPFPRCRTKIGKENIGPLSVEEVLILFLCGSILFFSPPVFLPKSSVWPLCLFLVCSLIQTTNPELLLIALFVKGRLEVAGCYLCVWHV